MDSLQVQALLLKVMELTEKNNKLMMETSDGVMSNVSGTELILALLTFLGGIWGVIEIYQKVKSAKDIKTIESESSFNKKVLEKEAEENRVFQQTMVESTQNSYITLVDSLMNFQQTFLLDLNKNIIQLTQQVQRAGSVSEAANRRIITFDKHAQSKFAELGSSVDSLSSYVRELQNAASISLKELLTNDIPEETIKDIKDTREGADRASSK